MAGSLQTTVSLVDGMAFDARTPTHTIRLDASPEVGGKGQGPMPMEMMLVSLGGCTGMDVISILRKMRQNVTAYEVNVSGDRADEHPKVFTDIVVEHVVTGHGVSEEAVRKAVNLSAERYCPASAMLGKLANVEHRFRIVEAPLSAPTDDAILDA